MATKTYKLRMDLTPLDSLGEKEPDKYHRADEVHQWLWDTHVVFNTGVDYLATWLLRMHRGAGVWRERKDGIWGEWTPIATHTGLLDVRNKVRADPTANALVENRELIEAFTGCGKTEGAAVELAECCRRIADRLCPPTEERDNRQMPRDSLDLLINPYSEARGLRAGPTTLRWELIQIASQRSDVESFLADAEGFIRQRAAGDEKDLKRLRNLVAKSMTQAGLPKDRLLKWCASVRKESSKKRVPASEATGPTSECKWGEFQQRFRELARRPGWLQDKVTAEEVAKAGSWNSFLESLDTRAELQDEIENGESRSNGKRRIAKMRERSQKPDADWNRDRASLIAETTAETDDYRRLLADGTLPIPGIGCYHDEASVTLGPIPLLGVGSEWKRSMWDMAGQRVRSHLGWVRRRAGERLLREKRKKLFEEGGWIRTQKDGKPINDKDFTAADILFIRPADVSEFAERKGFGGSDWFTELRKYERLEMPSHLQRTAFASGQALHLTYRTIKGWPKVREKWRDMLAKNASASQDELLEAVNKLRTRKSREFGDQRVFEWVADRNRRWLWDGSDCGERNDCGAVIRDCVNAFAKYNAQFSDRPESITFTQSHATLHPVWAFFGENSAVKYTLSKEQVDGKSQRLVLCLAQLLSRQADGSYQAKNKVRIPLCGYRDFESSFSLPEGAEVTAKQNLGFKDDLLSGGSRIGTLSGIKIMWHRGAMESAQNRHNESQPKCQKRGKQQPPKTPPTQRVYAAFSCDAGEGTSPEWVSRAVGKIVKLKKPRDGMTHAFFFDASVNKTSKGAGGTLLAPSQLKWPKEAVEKGFTARGTDLGFRTSSAGAWWRLSFDAPRDQVCWKVGHCAENDQAVYAVLDRQSVVSLPGDGEEIPQAEQLLRDRLRALRTRLNLNNMLLAVARLLSLDQLSRRVPKEQRLRLRGGVSRPNGMKWATQTEQLTEDEIKSNCRKAGERLLVWSDKASMTDSLKAIQFDGSIWQWLEKQDGGLGPIAAVVPKTVIPSEKEAKDQKIDREPLRLKREKEGELFANAIYTNRTALARVICDGYDGANRRRASRGLWAALDHALLKSVSYGDKVTREGKNVPSADGLLRLLRRPPVTKHHGRKDESNNLPNGRTHRGGLSMSRLNFLDEVKSFVRKWSCRPRWPGDLRRLSEDEKFDRQDTEHLDHLREHRAKLIAHADVAQTLGFEQDLRRGVWRYQDKKNGESLWHRPERQHFYRDDGGRLTAVPTPLGMGSDDAKHPHPAYAPAHVLVYEDLSRYKMRADRPKNENAGLARWSHRSILKYAQHIGGLFGVPVATVPAAYSSRFCHLCGAPGCRAVRFDPHWLGQEWMSRVLSSSDVRDAPLKGIARRVQERLSTDATAFAKFEDRLWVLREGGTHFVCSNRNCSAHTRPIDADENAAANIGLWFLRGIDDFRVKIDGAGKPGRPLRFLIATRFQRIGSDNDPFWLIVEDTRRQKRVTSTENSENEEEEDDESSGTWLFRDPSGKSFCSDHWYPPKLFWGRIAEFSAAGIKTANGSFWSQLDED